MAEPSQAALDSVLREIARPPIMPPPSCRSLLGHRFEPRFDVLAVDREEIDDDRPDTTHVWRVRTQKTYRGDVCVRCGVLANSPDKAEG